MEKKTLKISFLSAYSGETQRGAETFVHELSNNLVALGHTVSVYQNGPKLLNSTYKTIALGLHRSLFFILVFTLKALSNLPTDTQVVVPTNGRFQTLFTKLWCVFHHKKMVVSGQSGPGFDDRINILCFPDRFVAISSVALQKAKTDNRFVKSILIPNGVDLKQFVEGRSKLQLHIKAPVVLCVSALIEKKRIDLVIAAVSKLKNVSLLVVGSGSHKNVLTKLADEKLPGRHQFIEVLHNEMPDIYRAADVFTLVSDRSEAFGIVYAEALATNLPVVARDDSARREIIGSAGVFVKHPEDELEYAKAIQRALTKNWGDIPLEQAKKFDWTTIAKKYEELFISLYL